MRNLISFDTLMTPTFIHVFYWLGIAVAVLAAVGPILGGGIVKGLLIMVVGPILVRVGCEVLIVLFRINDNLAAIRAGKQV
ncbi:MAG TPA: DUF4282 domain-containing protein [Candidatus Methylomirabilis sp.]|nr:DUF4282 domain-containing protein [Candidatus Methylomirabilis sp.]